MRRLTPLWLLGLPLLLGLPVRPAPDAAPARFSYTQVHMGVPVRLVVYAADEAAAREACRAAYARVAELDAVASDYRRDSELNRLCARSGEGPVAVSADLFGLLAAATDLARRSAGAFDVTVGPYVALWRQARHDGRLPAAAALDTARARVGWDKLDLDSQRRTVSLRVPQMRLDLGGIAKGWAGDDVVRVLRGHGVDRALFEAGGDIVVSGPPPGEDGWRIQLSQPGETDAPYVVQVADAGVSTSGDSAQFVEVGGVRYSHVVDPRTGVGLTRHLVATVIAPAGRTSDSLATAASVLGGEEGGRLVASYPGTWCWIRPLRPAAEGRSEG